MGKCVYNYNGTEFATREELKQHLILNGISRTVALKGNRLESDNERMLMEAEARAKYGTSDFLTFSKDDNGDTYVSINDKALQDLSSAVKTFKRPDGTEIDINLDDLASNPKESLLKLDGVRAALRVRIVDKIIDNLTRQGISTPQVDKEDLKGKLFNFLANLGISVEYFEASDDVEAIADLSKRLISLSNENDLGQFSEEVAHFAVEMFDDRRMVDKMLEKVDQTNEYKNNYLRYKIRYAQEGLTGRELDRKVRKEILGKILSQKIQDNFSETASNSAEVGIFTQLQNLWNKLLDLFRLNDTNKKFFREFGQVLDNISTSVLEGSTDTFNYMESKEYFYSLSSEDRKLKGQLENILDKIRNKYADKAKGNRYKELQRIEEEILTGQYYLAAQAMSNIIKDDVQRAADILSESRRQDPNNEFDGINFTDLFSVQTLLENFRFEMDSLEQMIVEEEIQAKMRKSAFADVELRIIKDQINSTKKVFSSIEQDMRRMSATKVEELLRKSFEAADVAPKVIEEMIEAINKQKDISSVSRWIKSPAFMGNPVVQAIVLKVMQADSKAHLRKLGVVNEFENQINKENVSVSESKELFDGYSMINGVSYEGVEAMEEERRELRDHIAEKRKELLADPNTTDVDRYNNDVENSKKEFLLNAKYHETPNKKIVVTDVNKLRVKGKLDGDLVMDQNGVVGEVIKVENGVVTVLDHLDREVKLEGKIEALEGFMNIHPNAKEIIRTYNSRKYDILRKFMVGGVVRYDLMTDGALSDLSALNAQFRRDQNEFTETGVKKSGRDLLVAQEIKRYYDERGFSPTEISPEMQDKFEEERKAAYAKGDAVYRRWLKVYSINTYDKDTFEKMETGGFKVDEEAAQGVITNKVLDTVLANLGMNLLDFQKLPDGKRFSTLYERLVEKRKKLAAPYKEIGEFNQIKGDIIEDNLALKESINRISNLLGYFPRQESRAKSDLIFDPVVNKAFENKLKSLQGEERNNFLLEHVALKPDGQFATSPITGKYIPKTYYYRTYDLYNSDETPVGKKPQPSFNWIMNNVQREEQNPDYSFELAEKGIPQYSKYVKNKYKNQKFFDLFGIDPNTDFHGLNGATKNQSLFNLRKLMLEQKAASDKREGIRGAYYTLPSVASAGAKEAFRYSGSVKEVLTNFKSLLNKAFTLTTEDEESGITGASIEQVSEDRIQEITYKNKLFTRYRAVLRNTEGKADPSLLSKDITYMYLTYIQEGIDVEEKAKVLPEINMFINKLENTSLKGKDYADSNLKKAIDPFIRRMVYNQSMESGYLINIGGIQFSTTKALRTLYHYGSKVNLGFNTPVAATGLLMGQTNIVFDAMVNKNVNKDNIAFAYSHFKDLMPDAVKTMGKLNPDSKLMQMQRFTTMIETNKINQGLLSETIYRALGEQVGFLPMEIAGRITSSISILAVTDAYRLMNTGYVVLDGNGNRKMTFSSEKDANDYAAQDPNYTIEPLKTFVNLNGFLEIRKRQEGSNYDEAAATEEYENSREFSYYNFMTEEGNSLDEDKLVQAGYTLGMSEQDKNNALDILITRMNRNIRSYNSEKEGQLSEEEKTAAQFNPFLNLAMMHKGFLPRIYASRFNSKYYNVFTGMEEEGSYTTFGRLALSSDYTMQDKAKIMGTILSLGLYRGMYNIEGLTEIEKANMRRLSSDIAMFIALGALTMLGFAAMDADDDEESLAIQYAAYIAARGFNEAMSTNIFGIVGEAYSVIKDPMPVIDMGVGFVTTPFSLPANLIGGGTIKKGAYKGKAKWFKDFVKLSALKNVYHISDPKLYNEKTLWMRNQGSWMMKNMYETFLLEE